MNRTQRPLRVLTIALRLRRGVDVVRCGVRPTGRKYWGLDRRHALALRRCAQDGLDDASAAPFALASVTKRKLFTARAG